MLSIKIINKNKVAIKLFLSISCLVILVYIFSVSLIWTNKISYLLQIKPVIINGVRSTALLEIDLLKSHINSVLPIIGITSGSKIKTDYDNGLDWIVKATGNFDIKKPHTIIASEVVLLNIYEALAVTSLAKIQESNIPNMSTENIDDFFENENKIEDENVDTIIDDPSKEVIEKEFAYPKNQYINNETDFNIDTAKLLKEKLSIKLTKNMLNKDPTVLIIHTHTSEAYTPTKDFFYVPSDPDRTEKPEYNVVRVGQELTKELGNMGIKVIHDKTVHDFPSYRGSYNNSLKTAQNILSKHPSIKFVLDIHRDAFITKEGNKMKVITQIGDKKVAQIMFVVGTNASGLEHPNWRENLKLALKLQDKLYKQTPGIARLINLSKHRYNQHTTPGSLIIEIGSNGNTLDEALLSCKYLAQGISEVIKENIK